MTATRVRSRGRGGESCLGIGVMYWVLGVGYWDRLSQYPTPNTQYLLPPLRGSELRAARARITRNLGIAGRDWLAGEDVQQRTRAAGARRELRRAAAAAGEEFQGAFHDPIFE